MATRSFDVLVIGGGIHGAAVARDAAGRGLKVMLAEKGDYASATSSASSKLIHGGLRYLEQLELRLVRESLVERAFLLQTAPHLVAPIRFLLPLYAWQKRPAFLLRTGLALYDLLSIGDGLPASGKLSAEEIAALPRLKREGLAAVLHYHDCQTDDARLVLAVLLDARTRGADICNRRAVTVIAPLADGFGVTIEERGVRAQVEARFIVNAAGPWVGEIERMSTVAPEPVPTRLVRGSHIVLPMPVPAETDAYTLQEQDGRVVFAMPWLNQRFLLIGTTEIPHSGDAGEAHCGADERAYLLDAYNRHFAGAGSSATGEDIVFSFAGVRVLQGRSGENPTRLTRRPALSAVANGGGGFVSLYGGKLTTHRLLAEEVMTELARRGLDMRGPWTAGVPLFGGGMSPAALLALVAQAPPLLSRETCHRWAFTYGDQIERLYEQVLLDPSLAHEIAPGVPLAELNHAAETEDAMTAEDFLERRTKLRLTLAPASIDAVEAWFITQPT